LNFLFPAISSPLYLQFNENYTDERQALENIREASWHTHFAYYGRGSTMYRTEELRELIFQGIPESLRNELWSIFSGAIHDVSLIFIEEFSFKFFYVFFLESSKYEYV
jgi:hypothetical protein